MRRIFVISLILGCIAFSEGSAQENKAGPGLTLEECIQTGLKNRPEMEIAILDILNAEHQIKEASSYYYPRFKFNAGYTRFNRPAEFDLDLDIPGIKKLNKDIRKLPPPFNLLEFPSTVATTAEVGKQNWAFGALDVEQPVYTFGRIEEAVKQARIGQSIAVNQKEKKKEEIVLDVKKGYYQFLFSRAALQILKEAGARGGIVAKMAQIAYETSVPDKEEKGVTRLDFLKAKNFLSEIKAKLAEMNKNVVLAELSLKVAMGVNAALPLTVMEVPVESLPMETQDVKGARETVLDKNTDLKTAEQAVQLFDSRRRAASKEYLPKIGIQGEYIGPKDQFGTRNFWYAGIGVTIPLFDGFLTRAKVGQAEAQLQKIKSQKHLLESGLLAQVEQLNANLVEQREKIQILREAIKEAQERLDLASDGYAAGITEYDDLLLAQKAELEMKSAYLQSLFLYQMAKAEMEFISGAL